MFAWRALPAASGHGPGAVLTVPSLAHVGIQVAFTGRGGGLGATDLNLSLLTATDPERTRANRRRVAAAVGATLGEWSSGQQVHGMQVAHIGRSDVGRGAEDHATALPDTDALWTDEPGASCVVLTADCVPILLADPARRRIAVIHAGWRGMVKGVIDAAVAAMGASRDLRAYIGPAIGPCCYEVGDAVRGEAAAALTDAVLVGDHLDLWRGARIALARAGCTAIHPSHLCTKCQTQRFFSHRAGDVGRQALIARIAP